MPLYDSNYWEPLPSQLTLRQPSYNTSNLGENIFKGMIGWTIPVLAHFGGVPNQNAEADRAIRAMHYKLNAINNKINQGAQARVNKVAVILLRYAQQYSPIMTGWLQAKHTMTAASPSGAALAQSTIHIKAEAHPLYGTYPNEYGAKVHSYNPWFARTMAHAPEAVEIAYANFPEARWEADANPSRWA